MSEPALPSDISRLTGIPDFSPLRLDHLRVLRISGADASSFLQGQLTCDVGALRPAAATLGAWCSAKGRALVSFLLTTDGQDFRMVLPAELADAVKERLTMFVLRAKVRIDADEEVAFGLVGAAGAAPAVPVPLPGPWPQAVWERSAHDGVQWIRMPDAAGLARWLALVTPQQAAGLAGPASAAGAGAALWRWLEIRAGLPMVLAATQDKFVPQMINLEALDAVSFRKGCYPGQEVVARSQYLGKLKRRTFLAHAAPAGTGDVPGAPVAPGGDVFDAAGNPVGTVVNIEAAPGAAAGFDLLVEVPVEAAAHPLFLAGSVALTQLELPYPLPDNEVFVRPKL